MRHWIAIATAGFLLATAAYADLGVLAFVPEMEPLTRVDPVYPETARTQHISGLVWLLATTDPQGRVVDVEILTGPSVLRQAAIDAVKKWTFQPILRNG